MARPRKESTVFVELQKKEMKQDVLFAPSNALAVEVEATEGASFMRPGTTYIVSGSHANTLIRSGSAVLKKVISQ